MGFFLIKILKIATFRQHVILFQIKKHAKFILYTAHSHVSFTWRRILQIKVSARFSKQWLLSNKSIQFINLQFQNLVNPFNSLTLRCKQNQEKVINLCLTGFGASRLKFQNPYRRSFGSHYPEASSYVIFVASARSVDCRNTDNDGLDWSERVISPLRLSFFPFRSVPNIIKNIHQALRLFTARTSLINIR